MSTPSASVCDVDQARGLLLGLILGDALAFQRRDPAEWVRGSAAGQLACYTVEGLIRAEVAKAHGWGSDEQPLMVWFAYRRWASGQGVRLSSPVMHSTPWPDGWLSQQAAVVRRLGRAPATLKAAQASGMGSPEYPTTTSAGHHALSNSAPAALFAINNSPGEMARAIAGLTHGARAAQDAAATAVETLAHALHGNDLPTCQLLDGPSGTAQGALYHGLAAARAEASPAAFLEALALAHRTGGRGAATFAGALLGALHGATALPRYVLESLELASVADVLARDAVLYQSRPPRRPSRRSSEPFAREKYPAVY